ncbi:peptidase S45 [Halobacteriales archaeon QS_8_69_26]|nr:MAG: peptidase S45 [Halobacteriales archaeon QS_8_69_26]
MRRALIAVVLGGGVAGLGLSPASSFLDRFAPFSGSFWASATRDVSTTVESPHGAATLRYDDHGVPHVSADDEWALYFAVGYAQANDRLFQMDVLRRRMRGRLSELAGPGQLETDRFHVKMDFVGAAEATWAASADSRPGRMARAYTDGVNAFIENERLPAEFAAAQYEPDPWTPVDTILQAKQISWGLTGKFGTLRRALVRETLGPDAVADLYPERYDFDQPIIRPAMVGDAEVRGVRTGGSDDSRLGQDVGSGPVGGSGSAAGEADATGRATRPGHAGGVDAGLVGWLSGFEWPDGIGSNSWVVSGEHTSTGRPIVANDTHLTLTVPPVWYEMNLDGPDHSVRGFTFPGVPFVVIGENEHSAWGFTNSNADVIDFYEYETTDDGEAYRYRGETRAFETEERTIPVSGAEDETVTVRKTVHGPYLRRQGAAVGVSWIGLTATRTTRSVYRITHSEGLDDVMDAMRTFDEPSQNFVYADRDGRTLYLTTGKVPVRRVDGEAVTGDRVFDGTAGEGEWAGFEPYGETDWSAGGFVPFEEMPTVVDPSYLATANQRIADDPVHYMAERYSDPFRGIRAYELLDGRIREDGEPVTPEFAREMQRDAVDHRATRLVERVLDARERMSDRARDLADELAGWDGRMDRDARAPLVFELFVREYRRAAFEGPLRPVAEAAAEREAGDGAAGDSGVTTDDVADFVPSEWVVATLASSEYIAGDRAALIAEAMDAVAAELGAEDWETYGDFATADFSHPLGSVLPFMNYPSLGASGSGETLRNFHTDVDAGSSQRMVATLTDDVESVGILPGGNSGDYFSDHYDDQLRPYLDGEFKTFSLDVEGDVAVEFEPEG